MFNPEEDQEAFDFAFEDIVKSTLRDTWMNNLNPFPQEQRMIQFPGIFIKEKYAPAYFYVKKRSTP